MTFYLSCGSILGGDLYRLEYILELYYYSNILYIIIDLVYLN